MLREESPARNLFNRLIGGVDSSGFNQSRVDALQALFKSGTPESSILDFKCGQEVDGPRKGQTLKDDDRRRIWAKALSGFANTEGGVLVWGIDAPQDKVTGYDVARSAALVPDVTLFETQLRNDQPTATEPSVPGVVLIPVPVTPDSKEGFVVCFIPLSSWRPHRTTKEKEFYLRSSNNFSPAPVALVKSLFIPHRPTPAYEVSAVLNSQLDLLSGKPGIDLRIRNIGLATAKELVLKLKAGAFDCSCITGIGFTKHYYSNGSLVVRADHPIHPGDSLELSYQFEPDLESLVHLIEGEILATDTERMPFYVRFEGDELERGTKKRATLGEAYTEVYLF